jgi:hypothetical protein
MIHKLKSPVYNESVNGTSNPKLIYKSIQYLLGFPKNGTSQNQNALNSYRDDIHLDDTNIHSALDVLENCFSNILLNTNSALDKCGIDLRLVNRWFL